jgi:hypothetical protein
MSEEAYHEIPLLPLPIPQVSHGDLDYMMLVEAITQPFTDKQAPTILNIHTYMQANKGKTNNIYDIDRGLHLPRCLSSNPSQQWD